MKHKKKELYIEILLWIYKKGHVGFTKEEMRNELNVSDKEWPWVNWMTFNPAAGAELLAWSDPDSGEYGIRFYATSSGMAAAVDYMELKEVQKNSKTAFWTAIIAIFISATAMILQIILPQEIKPVKIKNDYIRTEVINLPNNQKVQVGNEFLKTEIINWPK
ncbi:MAG: hypothetical protein KA007_02785 [Candidatus Pacebacteria bacterium]|nr:hypothetical protein [Candidatus Paceibacterota bacterium]